MANTPRYLYIDNLRWVMIMLVVSMHAAVTYSHLGSWYFMEERSVSMPERFAFGTYQTWLQAFFMGFLFFIAGYFVPRAYDAKGAGRFLRDRFVRLGLPLLFFVFLLQPISVYLIFIFTSDMPWSSFGESYVSYIRQMRWLGGTGPLWFCEALLIFCVVYALYRVLRGAETKKTAPRIPTNGSIWIFVALIAVCSFLVRIPWPNGTNFYNLQLCYFSQYVFFFAAGILAYRGDWLRRFPASMARYWGFAALFIALPLWLANIFWGGAMKGDLAPYAGGITWQSLVECCREQLGGVGISIALLLWFRRRWTDQGRVAGFFSVNAFAVYVFHTPVLIFISKLMISLHWPLLIKFLVLTILSITVTYALSALIFRRIPLLKNIL